MREAGACVPVSVDLRSERPDRVPGNLPHQLTSFVGRTEEVADVAGSLADARLLTLTGAGGCGKSRVALEVATVSRERYPGGTWWVALAELRTREQIETALAVTLGVRALPGQTTLQAAEARLATARSLIALDNCEHLLEPAAEVAESVLCACPQATILATSRAPLGVAGEVRLRVPAMSPPDAQALFCERARAVRPDLALTSETVAAIATICKSLDGIALALELAAARVRMMSVHEIAEALADSFRLLTGGPRRAPAHQRTLRASVAWSHDLLRDGARALLRRLAVFDGGWTLPLAETVAAGDGIERRDVLDLLSSLVDNSLVVVEENYPSTCYGLLDAVRRFALERLAESGEEAGIRERHLDAFLELAERAEPQLVGEQQQYWLAVLASEHANFEQALDHAIRSDPGKALRLVVALAHRYRRSGRFGAADRRFERALAATPEPTPGRARALGARAWLNAHAGNWARAIEGAQLALNEPAADASTKARALTVIGFVQQFRDPTSARAPLHRGRSLAREADDPWCEVFAAQSLAWTYHVQDRAEPCRALIDEVLPLVERHGYGEFLAKHHLLVSLEAFGAADWRAFDEHCGRGLEAAQAADEPLLEGSLAVFLGWSQILRGRTNEAAAHAPRARERAVRAGAGLILPGIEYVLAWVDLVRGDARAALRRLDPIIATGIDGGPYLGRALVLQAESRRVVGDADGARRSLAAAHDLARRLDAASILAEAQLCQARVAIDAALWAAAGDEVHGALGAIEDRGLTLLVAPALEVLAQVAAGLGNDADAARLLGAAARARADTGLDRLHHAERLAELDCALSRRLAGGEHADAAAGGARLTTREAVAWARRGRGQRRRPAAGWESLTPTEREVVDLVAEGLTNPQIAARMFVARGTVKTHLSHIYAKLDLRNRSELAAEAVRRQASMPR